MKPNVKLPIRICHLFWCKDAKWSEAGVELYLQSYVVTMKSEWKLPVAWPTEEGQNMYWFLFCLENCMSCVRLREEREGKPPQVKQLFRDEIIVWLHLFTPMAQRGSAKQHNCLCYLIAASTPSYEDIFQRVRLRDILSSSWLLSSDLSTNPVTGCLLPVMRNSFWMCQLKETHDVCMCWKQLRSTLLMLTSLAAPLLLSGACVSVAFGGNSFLYHNCISERTLNSRRF